MGNYSSNINKGGSKNDDDFMFYIFSMKRDKQIMLHQSELMPRQIMHYITNGLSVKSYKHALIGETWRFEII